MLKWTTPIRNALLQLEIDMWDFSVAVSLHLFAD